MINQQPLTLQLSNGEEVSIQANKSILQFTENNQQHNCAIVRGEAGTVVSNATGDVQINGAPSSTHLLQAGDQLQFGSSITASVQQLGEIERAIESSINQQDQPSAETAPVSVPAAEEATFSPATAATEFTPATQAAVVPSTPNTASLDLPTMETNTPEQPEISSFAANLLASIKADESEPVGTQTSETTHSSLATDGSSFSSPTDDSSVPPSTVTPEPETFAEVTSTEPSQMETTTAESASRQVQSDSVSALLERMKAEGQWDGVPAESETETQAVQETPASPEPSQAPVADEATDDVQSYMSQLLSRMRDPNDPKNQSATETATQAQQTQAAEAAAAADTAPAKTKLLKPEEYVPKTKAKRLDSLQDMRALANTQTRSAIDRSQAKRAEAFSDHFYLAIAITSVVVAALVCMLNIFGNMTFPIAMVSMITGAFFCCKTFFADTIQLYKDKQPAAATNQQPSEELAE